MYIVGLIVPFVDREAPRDLLTMKTRFLTLCSALVLSLSVGQLTAQSGPAVLQNSFIQPTAGDAEYKTLMHALKATRLQEVLQKSGPFTVFAPSDSAFEKMAPERMVELLKPENQDELRTVLAYHIVAGELTASRILRALCRGEGSARFTTVQGEELLATLEGIDIILTDCSGNRARIVSADTNRNNLVFHEIDKVIVPSSL